MRSDIADMREKVATRDEVAEFRPELRSLRVDIASNLHAPDATIDASRQSLSVKIAGLRRTIVE